MRIAFYAPLKPPHHPVPSGDRRMARLLITALEAAGHEVEVASVLRSRDGAGDPARQQRIAALGSRIAARYVRQVRAGRRRRPDLWLTYHLYHKAPDWIGPNAAAALGIPYVAAEASVAPKRAGGPWDLGHRQAVRALGRADAVIGLNSADRACVLPLLADPARWVPLAPFIDAAPFAAARARQAAHRADLAREHGIADGVPWLAAVGMFRPGDKLASYEALGRALRQVGSDWRLLVVGDGEARPAVEAALGGLGGRVHRLGALPEARIPGVLAACDLYVWPAVNEAYGLALLEAQAAGLPVVAGRVGGVPDIVGDGETSLLVPPGDDGAFAAAVAALLADPAQRRDLGATAARRVRERHGIEAAADRLDALVRCLIDRAVRGVSC